MNLADEDKIFNLKEASKTALTLNMNPDRLQCLLSTTAGKHNNTKRLYLQALPFYIEDHERRQKIVTEGFKTENLCPPRRLDYALDPVKMEEAARTHQTYQEMLDETSEKKIQYLTRLTQSEMYRKKSKPASQQKVVLFPTSMS
jgi:hypothetical protein